MEENRYERIFPVTVAFSFLLMVVGLVWDGPIRVLQDMLTIATEQDLLITDYFAIAGVGAALVNAGLMTLISILVIKLAKDPFNGFTIVEMGLMCGFSLFGKNIWNMWPFVLGAWLYAKYQKEPFSKYASVALLSTCLAPLVSYMSFGSIRASLGLGLVVGMVVGFILPPLSAYTYKVQNGMNLYNMGFACGLVAMMIVPMLTATGDKPETVLYWAEGYNTQFTIFLSILCAGCILSGLFLCGKSPREVLERYRSLLATSGRAPSDYLRMFGGGAVLVNMGVNGLIGMTYILIIGGDLNGPTLGGIFTIMGFSAFGKHARNIVPVLVGVGLGAMGMHHTPTYPSLQIGALFGTTLAPIAGHFGWPYGVLAGFIHSALVLQTSGPVAGLNLYNNGFSAGLIALVLYPTITAIRRHRSATIQNEDYFDVFEESKPIDASEWSAASEDRNEGEVIGEEREEPAE